jgi:hypothetical protein
LRETLTNFDVAKAKLAHEADRAMLLGIINELFLEKDAPVDSDAHAERSGHASSSAEKAEKIGHTLREHMTGQSSPKSIGPNAVSLEEKEEGQVKEEEKVNSTTDDGLAAFNHNIKVNVRDQLPTVGIQSWCILGYQTTVLLGSLTTLMYRSLFYFFDFWGFVKTGSGESLLDRFQQSNINVPLEYKDWRSIFSLVYMTFVINPFQMFLIFAHLKIWLTLHAWSKWPQWTNYAFFMTGFLIIQAGICLPMLIKLNMTNLWFDLVTGDGDQYKIYYQPVSGPTLLFLLKNKIDAIVFTRFK